MTSVLYLGPESHYPLVRQLLAGFDVRFAVAEPDVDAALPSCAAVLDAYMKVRFDAPRIAAAAALRLFVTATTGASHIDADCLGQRAIPLWTLKGQEHITRNLTAAAEHSWLLLMAVARQLPVALREALDGGWERNKYPGIMLRGRTIGIVGCGRIGEWMARYALAFGMRVLGYDAYRLPEPSLFEPTDLETLLEQSDFVSLHVPLLDTTRNLLSAERLKRLKPGAIVINTSRGEVLDEGALLAGLTSGRVGGAGLDVLRSEPDVQGDPLVAYAQAHHNLIITPHIGGFSPDALNVVLEFSCKRIRSFFDD